MDIVNDFKKYLLSQKNPSSTVTIKNYLSDVRRFINWYSNTFHTSFYGEALNSDIITQYRSYVNSSTDNALPAASSAKRYISSLRKFSSFLEHSGVIKHNPFIETKLIQAPTDPYYLKEFKNFLFTEHASKLTIKNYILDIKQFIDWLQQVADITALNEPNEIIQNINANTLEQYKNRLLNEAKFSPVSINRKLSSLRRYTGWLTNKGILEGTLVYFDTNKKSNDTEKMVESVIPDLPLVALQGLSEEKQVENGMKYSNIPPVRLIQKTNKVISLGFELLILTPITHIAEAIYYSAWKNSKKSIFTPVNAILESSSYIPTGVSIKTIIPKQASSISPQTTKLASLVTNAQLYGVKSAADTVHNFTKALYAPLSISTTHMHWKDKLLYHIRYTRPDWYRKYHTYSFVHYLHIGILVLSTVIAGSLLYNTWAGENIKQHEAVLSAQDTAPPRTLEFQGRLLDKTNNPITAETPLRFALYNSPIATGAAMLWQENQNIKPDQSGYFSTTLGENNRIKQNLFTDNPSLYVGITVGNNQELSPRQQIPTSDLSNNSQSVEGMKPITDSPSLAQNVLLDLDSSGNLTLGGNSNHTFQATGGKFNLSGQSLLLTTNPGSNGNVTISPDGSGIIDIEKPIQNISKSIGRSGILGAVEVDDILSILATSSSQSALVINQNGTGDIVSGRSHGIDKFRLDSNGNEFIGGNLILNGDTIGTNSTIFDIGGSNVNTLTLGNSAKVLTLGASTGITSINNSLSVQGTTTLQGPTNINGLLTANAGLTVPSGQKIIFGDFSPNAIPFINNSKQLVQDAGNFSWNDPNKNLQVVGSLCVNTTPSGTCDTTPGRITSASLNTVGTADLAEDYVSSQKLDPGDVVVMEGQGNTMAVIKSTSPYQKELIGIISTNPGVTLNSGAKTDSTHQNVYPLALQGRVPVKVSSINGSIEAGDNITSSSIPGVAMKASASGQIIGKALEGYTNSDTTAIGQIMTFVNLSYQSFPTTVASNGNLAVASQSGSLQSSYETLNLNPSLSDIAKYISVDMLHVGSLSTQSLEVATENITINGQPLKDYITSIVEAILHKEFNNHSTRIQTTEIISPVASNSALTTNQSISNRVKPSINSNSSGTLETANNKSASPSSSIIYNIYNSIATESAKASTSATPTPIPTEKPASSSGSLVPPEASNAAFDVTQHQSGTDNISKDINGNQYEPVASISAVINSGVDLKSDFGTFSQGLIALGPTSLTDVSVSDSISINNNLKITANSINTIGSDLNIQPLRQGNVLFMGGLVAIDTQGDLTVSGNALFANNVNVNGQLAAGIIAPIPNNDLTIDLNNKSDKTGSSLIIRSATGSGVLQINQSGDLTASGTAKFNSIASSGFSIIRGAQADTSMTQTVANGSAGTGVITAYETQRTIVTPYVAAHSLIYITPTTNSGGITPYLARQTVQDSIAGTQGSFTVAIPTSSTKNVGFNWWIVN